MTWPTSGEQSKLDLQQALANLETFSQQIERELVPNFSNLAVHAGKLVAVQTPSLTKTIAQAYSNLISPTQKESSEVVAALLQSSDTIKSYFPLIQVMSEGSPEQKKFANYAKTAIERFNRTVDKATSSTSTWTQRIICFLYQKNMLVVGNRLVKIELPRNAFLPINSLKFSIEKYDQKKMTSTLQSPPESTAALQKISTLGQAVLPSYQIEQKTFELYQIKIFKLLEKDKLLSPLEARELVLKTPREFIVDQQAELATISQKLQPLPGQCFHVSASFQIDRRTCSFSIFQSDDLVIESTQTGYPHPLQHNGWALSDMLIPKCLHRPERLKHFPELYEKQLKIAQELDPKGPLVEKARYLLAMKRQVFEENKMEFLKAHKALCFAISDAAFQNTVPHDFSESISSFFTHLSFSSSSYDLLVRAQEQLMDGIVNYPFIALDKEWLNGTVSTCNSASLLLSTKMEEVFDKWSEKALEAEKLNNPEKKLLHYCSAMGRVLAHPVQQLILQQHSEKMKTAPPELDVFTKKIQVALYLQLWEFLHELSLNPKEIDPYRHLSRLLEDDLMLFKATDLNKLPWKSVAIVNELETYYKERALEA
ncbi:MAG: hypothetical protein H0T62_02710 [Parachlamydiaceae bacterium]|nr:hypothetical protein [Parachlamydiaceae bacterium]